MGAERRRHPRVTVDAPVKLFVAGIEYPARIRDICREAVLIEAGRSWPMETEVRLQMELPGMKEQIDVVGRVIRHVPGESGGHGMAILFGDVTPLIGVRIDFFVALLTDLKGVGGGPPPTA
jgi:hypothetical protein